MKRLTALDILRRIQPATREQWESACNQEFTMLGYELRSLITDYIDGGYTTGVWMTSKICVTKE